MNLFDLLEKEASKKKEEPLTQLVFGGEICSSGSTHQPHTSIVLCLTCNNVSRTIDPFNNLMLEIQFRSSHSKPWITHLSNCVFSENELMKKYCQENRVMSVRGGSTFGLSREASKYIDTSSRNRSKSRKKPGFFKRLLCCCTGKPSGMTDEERDIQPRRKTPRRQIKTDNGKFLLLFISK